MEFKVDSCHTGIEEMSQNLLHKIEREFFDLSRWSMSFIHELGEHGDFKGKTVSLVWKPSDVVYDFLKRKYNESIGNHLPPINVKTLSYGTSGERDLHGKTRKFGNIHRRAKQSDFDDDDNTIFINFFLRKNQLKFKYVCEENPEVLMATPIRLVLRVPLVSKRLGFPFIRKPTQEWKENHCIGYGNDGKIINPVGGGPIRLFCSFNVTISNLKGIYNPREHICFGYQYTLNYKLIHNVIWNREHGYDS